MEDQKNDHWLASPQTVKKLWLVLIAILVALLVAEFFVHHHPHFQIEKTFAFAAWFGFAACIVMAIVAKVLGIIFKRLDTYYND